MKTQISRNSHDPNKRYSGVYQQQGRMITDADWNELVSIVRQRADEALRDVVGSGAPLGRQLTLNNDLQIVPGNVYADGVMATFPGSTPVEFANQQDFPASPPGAPPQGAVVYADVWERPVLYLEDGALRDPGLHGADTTTRTQAMVQVKRCHPTLDPLNPSQNPQRGNAELTLELRAAGMETDSDDPCATVVQVDQAVRSFLFRLEVHNYTQTIKTELALTLKWSTENASEMYPNGQEPASFKNDKFIYEFYNDKTEKHLGWHLVSGWNPWIGDLRDGYPSSPPLPTMYPWVRRWDGYCRLTRTDGIWALTAGKDNGVLLSTSEADDVHGHLEITTSGTLKINLQELDLQLVLEADGVVRRFVPGDYWLAAARETDAPGAELLSHAAPLGIVHHYTRLGQVGSNVFVPDRFAGFPSLMDLTSQAPNTAGASRIGADAVAGSPSQLLQGTVDSQLASLLAQINNHLNPATAAHLASAISALAVVSSPNSLAQGTVATQLSALLGFINYQSGQVGRIYGNGSAGALEIVANTNWGAYGSPANQNLQFTNLTINSGWTLTVPSGTVIRVTGSFINFGTITVQPYAEGSAVHLKNTGTAEMLYRPSAQGFGRAPSCSGERAVGGGTTLEGGWGGRGVGNLTAMALLLSPGPIGGGGGAACLFGLDGTQSASGGLGGGTLVVLAAGAISNAGTINANGAPPLGSMNGSGGGGGGLVILASRTSVANSGTINAQGGAGSGSGRSNGPGGGGGGGIIQLIAPDSNSTGGTLRVEGGAKGPVGSPGSIDGTISRMGGGGGGGSGGDGGNGGGVDKTNPKEATSGHDGTYLVRSLTDPTALF